LKRYDSGHPTSLKSESGLALPADAIVPAVVNETSLTPATCTINEDDETFTRALSHNWILIGIVLPLLCTLLASYSRQMM